MEDLYFYKTVKEMRDNQKQYFKTRDRYYLTESKKYEKIVDSMIEDKIKAVLFEMEVKEARLVQTKLFE